MTKHPILAVPMALAIAAHGNGLFQPASGPEDVHWAPTPADPHILRSRSVVLDRDRLSVAHDSRAPMLLNLFPDARLEATVTAARQSTGALFVYATLTDGGFATFLVVNGQVRGEVHSSTAAYVIKSAETPDVVTIEEVAPSTRHWPHHGPARHPAPRTSPRLFPEQHPSSITRQVGQTSLHELKPEPTIDLLVIYTPAAEAYAGGRAETEATILAKVEQTNQALANSGLGHRKTRLVAMERVEHTLSEELAANTFNDWKGTSTEDRTGILDEVFELRDRYAPDIVHLLIAGPPLGAGGTYSLYERRLAERLCSSPERASLGLRADTCLADLRRHFWRSSGSTGYSAISQPGVTFVHELGHNFGIRHDRYAHIQYGQLSLDDPASFPIRPYGFGYVNQNFSRPQCHRTVMSYPDQCQDEYDSYGIQHLMFSSPDLRLGTEADGFDPAGVPGDRWTVDLDGPVDAARAVDDVWDFLTNVYSKSESGHDVPFLPAAGSSLGEGFLRIVNHAPQAGEVVVEAFDDVGNRRGPVSFPVGPHQTVDLAAKDLETGSGAKGLTGAIGTGAGDWRLKVASLLEIEVLAYVAGPDGFLTPLHDLMPAKGPGRQAVLLIPGSDAHQTGALRLINDYHEAAKVLVTGTDDNGAASGNVRIVIPPHAARTFSGKELEEGGGGFEGALGDRNGNWRLFVESRWKWHNWWNAPENLARVKAMSLAESGNGRLSNLSPAPRHEYMGTHTVPLFPAWSASGRQGYARVANRTDDAVEVTIRAYDDTGQPYGPVTLSVDGGATAHFDADDLENGDRTIGLPNGIGAGTGDWRLELTSDAALDVLAYVRSADGFLTPMHDVAPSRVHTHRIPYFGPASEAHRTSMLRLTNAGDEDVQVTITGIDDAGESPGSEVRAIVSAKASRTYTAQQLEYGDGGLEGSLGDGAGAWQLLIEADREIVAMGLAETRSGQLVNLSTSPVRGVGPWPPPERDPSAAAVFGDRALDDGGAPLVLDLAAAFAGTGWEFSAASSDESVAEVSISDDGTLTVRQTGVGTTRITVAAVGPVGTRLVRTIVVRVRPPDDGDDAEGSTLLPIGPPLPGMIGDADDVDVFRIDLQGSATLEVRTSGQTDTRGELLDGTGALLASDDDSGPGGHNFLVRANLDAGTYYVRVTGQAGDYAVMARLGDAPDHGGTEATATLLTLYAEADLERVSPSALLAAPGRIAPSNADVDVFRFDVPLDDTEVTVRGAGGADVSGRLLDSSMTELAADTSDGNFRLEATLDAGTYYVVVTGSETGTYRVLAWGDSNTCACAAPTPPDHGGDPESSTLMPIGPPLAGTVDGADDVDMFRIDLQGSATLEVRTSGQTDTRGELLDGTGARILSDDDSGLGGRNFLVRADLDAGIYYVAVTGEPGDYAVMARLGDALDHGGTAALSTLLTLYAKADLARVSPSALLAAPGRIAPDDADVDVFRLDVPEDGMDVTVRSAGGTDVYARLLDSSLDEIAADDSDGNFWMEARLDVGVYYVEVGARETGTYRVLAWGDPDQPCACAAEGG